MCGLFLWALVAPGRFVKGIRLVEDGFEWWRPLRSPVLVRYADITQMEAVCHGDCSGGDDMSFVFHTAVHKGELTEDDVYGTLIFRYVAELPGYMPERFQEALNHKPNWCHEVVGGKFTIYEVAGGKDGPAPF